MAVEIGSFEGGATVTEDLALDALVREALEVPGAGAALLAAFAAQARALRLVLEAEALGAAALPPAVREDLRGAVARMPAWLS
ncbi:MAG: hypothetical protein MUF40_01305 [Gemmatimonadaceae bacterium]|nr:hypothetical protein [Gemmatimonadaceae bacterium]